MKKHAHYLFKSSIVAIVVAITLISCETGDPVGPTDARDNFPVATYTMKNTFFHGCSPVITPEQIAYIGEQVDGFMSLFI